MPAVTLDLWHTLMYLDPESEEEYMQAQVDLARRVLVDSPRLPGAPDLSEVELGRAFEREYAGAVAAANDGRTVTPAEQLVRAARATGRDPQPEAYLRGLELEVRDTPFQMAPGALDLLEALHGEGYRLAIISNTVGEPGAYLKPVLHAMGFDRYVPAVVFSDEHPWTKPAPEIFQCALDALGATADEAVHVGDGWSDVEGARRAGFRAGILYSGLHRYGARYKSLFLPSDWDRPATVHEVRRLDEVPGLVRSILSAPPGRR